MCKLQEMWTIFVQHLETLGDDSAKEHSFGSLWKQTVMKQVRYTIGRLEQLDLGIHKYKQEFSEKVRC